MSEQHRPVRRACLILALVLVAGATIVPASSRYAAGLWVRPAGATQSGQYLTGTWRCADGGTYYVRQIGNDVWWVGERTTKPAWTNVFSGRIQGRQIVGRWAHVPKGGGRGNGQLTMQILGAARLRTASQTGGFGGSECTR